MAITLRFLKMIEKVLSKIDYKVENYQICVFWLFILQFLKKFLYCLLVSLKSE